MEGRPTILYIHGMGGGADSRIPSILSECLHPSVRVVVRTYDFDPEIAAKQISSWIEELKPVAVAGESLGANHALAMHYRYGLPTVLVSPALNAPGVLSALAPVTLVPGVAALLGRIYRPRPGDRQPVTFRFSLLRKWKTLKRELSFYYRSKDVASTPASFFRRSKDVAFTPASFYYRSQDVASTPASFYHRSKDVAFTPASFYPRSKDESGAASVFAYFGTRDHYRRSGIVSLRKWRRLYGEGTFALYEGSHFMEETYVRTLLADRLRGLAEGSCEKSDA